MPAPADYTGDRELDALLDLRARTGAAALLVKEARDAVLGLDAERIASTTADRVGVTIRQETQSVVRELKDATQLAEKAARSAESAATGLSPRQAFLLALLGTLGGVVVGAVAGVYIALGYFDGMFGLLDMAMGAGGALIGTAIVGAVVFTVWGD